MAKITLTADEEIMYLETLDKIQEMMPDLEIEVVTKPIISRVSSNLGEDFKQFLKNTPTVITSQAYKISA